MQLALAETLRFIEPWLANRRRLLEVGCGDARLAHRLAELGHQVVGLDVDLSSAAPIAEIAGPGLALVEGDLLDHDGGPYDAVLFTRSLHHIPSLDAAIERAFSLLAPGGLVILEEFDVSAPDEATARWNYETWDLLEAVGAIDPAARFGAPGEDPLDRWRREHDETPPLHTGPVMIAALERRFGRAETSTAPYLYRALSRAIERRTIGLRASAHLFEAERRAIARGEIEAVGLRAVALR